MKRLTLLPYHEEGGVRRRSLTRKYQCKQCPMRRTFIRNILCVPDNFYKVEGAKDALICGNSSDAG